MAGFNLSGEYAMSQTITQRKEIRRYLSHNGRKTITVFPSGRKCVTDTGMARRIGYWLGKLFGGKNAATDSRLAHAVAGVVSWHEHGGISYIAGCEIHNGITVMHLDVDCITLD